MNTQPALSKEVEKRFDEWVKTGQSYMNPQDFVPGWHEGRLKQFIAKELAAAKAEGAKNKERQNIESLAKYFYEQMVYDGEGEKPGWVEFGNSLKQDEARDMAKTVLTNPSGKENE